MSDNQKVKPKSSFFKRNTLLIVIGFLLLGAGYLYLNKQGIIQNLNLNKDKILKKQDLPIEESNSNKNLEIKVASLEKLIRELASTMKHDQHLKIEPEKSQPTQNIIEIKGLDAYELLKSMNLILLNIDDQQIRNTNITKLQSQFTFFNEQRFQSFLALPDISFVKQQLLINEKKYIQKEFLKKAETNQIKEIIQNIFKVSISRNSDMPIGLFMTAIENSNYSQAVISYKNLSLSQKNLFNNIYEIAKSYEEHKNYLENLF